MSYSKKNISVNYLRTYYLISKLKFFDDLYVILYKILLSYHVPYSSPFLLFLALLLKLKNMFSNKLVVLHCFLPWNNSTAHSFILYLSIYWILSLQVRWSLSPEVQGLMARCPMLQYLCPWSTYSFQQPWKEYNNEPPSRAQ